MRGVNEIENRKAIEKIGGTKAGSFKDQRNPPAFSSTDRAG